jgi:hypothetical protein
MMPSPVKEPGMQTIPQQNTLARFVFNASHKTYPTPSKRAYTSLVRIIEGALDPT